MEHQNLISGRLPGLKLPDILLSDIIRYSLLYMMLADQRWDLSEKEDIVVEDTITCMSLILDPWKKQKIVVRIS